MRKAILALLAGAYLCIALAAAALFWRGGADWGAGAGVMTGVLAFLVGLHNLLARGLDSAALRREIAGLRDAHHILTDHLEETEGALEELATRMQAVAAARAPPPTGDARMLEDLVARIGEDLESRLAKPPTRATASPSVAREALLETISDALTENRVDLFLQPVVSLPQRRIAFYESFTRLRDASGRVLTPAQYLSAAEHGGLIGAVDNLLLFRCVQIVRRLARGDRKIGIFCNVSIESLDDDRFFPQTLRFLEENRDLASAVIFELGQAAFNARGATAARNMSYLAELGFRFSLDKVDDLDFDFADLQRAEVRFVKIGAEALLDQLLEVEGRFTLQSMRDLEAPDFAAGVRRFGVEPIVEKVESEREVVDLLELDIGYGQGNLFGEPRAIREQILTETAPPTEFLQARRQA